MGMDARARHIDHGNDGTILIGTGGASDLQIQSGSLTISHNRRAQPRSLGRYNVAASKTRHSRCIDPFPSREVRFRVQLAQTRLREIGRAHV